MPLSSALAQWTGARVLSDFCIVSPTNRYTWRRGMRASARWALRDKRRTTRAATCKTEAPLSRARDVAVNRPNKVERANLQAHATVRACVRVCAAAFLAPAASSCLRARDLTSKAKPVARALGPLESMLCFCSSRKINQFLFHANVRSKVIARARANYAQNTLALDHKINQPTAPKLPPTGAPQHLSKLIITSILAVTAASRLSC